MRIYIYTIDIYIYIYMNTLMRIMIDFYVIYLRPMSVYGLHIHIHEFAGMSQFVMWLCACWNNCDPTCPFQSQVRQAASAAGGDTVQVMTWVNINHQVNFTWLSLITQQRDTYSCPWLQIFHFRVAPAFSATGVRRHDTWLATSQWPGLLWRPWAHV